MSFISHAMHSIWGPLGLGALLLPKKDSQPSATIPAPPVPQAAKKADRGTALAANMAAAGPGGAMSGNSGTFLTGASGVDSSTLDLGKNTLLGQ